MNLRHESPNHAVITDDDKDHPWVATINTKKAEGLAEHLAKCAEEYIANRAKTANQ